MAKRKRSSGSYVPDSEALDDLRARDRAYRRRKKRADKQRGAAPQGAAVVPPPAWAVSEALTVLRQLDGRGDTLLMRDAEKVAEVIYRHWREAFQSGREAGARSLVEAATALMGYAITRRSDEADVPRPAKYAADAGIAASGRSPEKGGSAAGVGGGGVPGAVPPATGGDPCGVDRPVRIHYEVRVEWRERGKLVSRKIEGIAGQDFTQDQVAQLALQVLRHVERVPADARVTVIKLEGGG